MHFYMVPLQSEVCVSLCIGKPSRSGKGYFFILAVQGGFSDVF